MAQKKGLGRGLDALLGDYTEAANGVTEADVTLIDTNAEQPRKTFDEERLGELSASIKRHGMVQPIIVKPSGDRYTIVAGERRYRAAILAGLTTVPVIVKQFDEQQAHEIALIENVQRENLNPIEEAAAIRFLMQQHDLTQEEVSERLGKSRPAIANSLRLLNLPSSVQQSVKEGKLSAGHARALAGVKDNVKLMNLAHDIIVNGYSVRQAEQYASASNTEEKRIDDITKHPPREPRQTADMFAAQDKLQKRLGTKVRIEGTESRGKMTIDYYSAEFLMHLFDVLMGEEADN